MVISYDFPNGSLWLLKKKCIMSAPEAEHQRVLGAHFVFFPTGFQSRQHVSSEDKQWLQGKTMKTNEHMGQGYG